MDTKKRIRKPKKDTSKYALGQTEDTPDELDPIRMFYESAYKENPNSKMAEEWMLKHGLIAEDKVNEIAMKYGVQQTTKGQTQQVPIGQTQQVPIGQTQQVPIGQTQDPTGQTQEPKRQTRRTKNQFVKINKPLVTIDEDKEALELASTTLQPLQDDDEALSGDKDLAGDKALSGDKDLSGDNDDDEALAGDKDLAGDDDDEALAGKEKKSKKEYTPNEAMFEYYKLKQKWDKQNYNITHQKGKSNKPKCVNCGREGGTYFSTNNRVLVAYCTSMPTCKLNIEIHKGDGKIVLLRDLEHDLHKKINEYKKNIITIKLNLLFGYETEENTIELFKQNNKLLIEHERLLYECHNYLLQITEDRSELYKEYRETLENELREIKLINKLYIQTEEPEHIQEIIKKYVDVVYPLVEKIRNVKYSEEYIMQEEIKKNVLSSRLVQDEFNVQENEMYVGDEIKVVKFIL